MEGISESDDTPLAQAYYRDVETPDITRARHTGGIVEHLIQDLPKDMRRDRWPRTNKDLCGIHRGLNADLMHDVFTLIQREVGHHLRKFDAYPHLLKPLDILILKKLQAIQGMWRPDLNGPNISNAWQYEISGCQGCMVARVASDKNALRNLRVALLSRTQTRVNHVPRRLMKFVDACIDLFPEDVDELYGTSSQFAYILKNTRKACSKAWSRDPAHTESRRQGKTNSNHKSGKSARGQSPHSEYNPRKPYVQPPRPITTPHPAERLDRSASSLCRKASRSLRHMNRGQQCSPSPDRMTRLMDFAEDNHQGLAERSASVVDESPEKARSPSVASPHYRVSDEIDEVVEMYRSFGTTPSQSLRYSSLSERQEKVPLEALDSPSSIYSTSSRWTDESHDGRAEVCSEDVESGV